MIARKHTQVLLWCICVPLYFILFSLISCKNQPNQNNDKVEVVLANATKMLTQKQPVDIPKYLDTSFSINASLKQQINKYKLFVKYYYYHLPNYPKALIYLDSMEQALTKVPPKDFKNEAVFVLLHKGRLALMNKQFDDAFLYQYKAKLLIEELKDTCQGQQLSFALALILFNQEAYKDAATYFIESFTKGEQCYKHDYEVFFMERLMTPNNIGLCYERLNMNDSALYYYELGLKNVETDKVVKKVSEKNLNKTKAVYYGNIGGIMLKMHQTELAQNYLEKSIALNYHPEMDIKDAVLTKIKLAQLLVNQEKIIDSKFLISSIKSDLIQYPNPEAEARLAGVLKLYFKTVGDYKEANNYMSAEQNLRDSLRLANISNGVKKTIVAEFDQAKNIVELDSFKRDDRIKSLLLTASLITIFLSLIILLVFAFNRLQNKKHIAKLEVLNTALNTTNEKLEISLNSLEGSYADNDRLIKAVAHDMRSPMVAVVGVLDLLCSEEMDEESRANLLKLAKESSQKGLGVLDDVLKSKVNNELPKSLVDLKSIIESSVSVVNQSAIDKKQSIILDVADVAVNVNEGKIWRVLNNLLTNAIKFSFRGGKIEVSTQVDTDNVTISVKDFGIGIPENIRGNLFDFFTKASRKGTNGEETHGLGLAITKQIVEAHKGKIWVESEPNIGTTFYVQLPI